ncbi:MAG TPA: zf-HC2 domain-containing protein [Edaphobacter sp.]|nr:zf-HC2 domain-containing protein [Edaphobacter sp.]
MADINQFGSAKPPQTADTEHCARCEAMLADALDGTLSAADQAAFDLHMIGCESCSAMLADAQRGAAWMEMLKSPRPEPSPALLERILAQTSGQTAAEAKPHIVLGPTDRLRQQQPNTLLGRPALIPPSVSGTYPPMYGPAKVLPFRTRVAAAFNLRSIRQTLLQPRLAMTAAMAFFSIALTLNLTGVRISDFRISDLKPSNLMRSAYQAKARVVRYSDNLRVVYELESRVRDLQRSSDSDNSTPAPQGSSAPSAPSDQKQKPSGVQPPNDQKPGGQNPDQKQAHPRPKSGTSQRVVPGGSLRSVGSTTYHGSHTAPIEAFVIFSPSIMKDIQEGRLV